MQKEAKARIKINDLLQSAGRKFFDNEERMNFFMCFQ